MTILYTAPPGTASNTLRKQLEIILNCEGKFLKSGGGIGHLILNIPFRMKFFKKFKLNFLNKSPLVCGHIFPTKYNFNLLNDYFDVKHTIISYRNIYEQLNYFYKLQKYNLRCPLNFPEDNNFSNSSDSNLGNFNIDLNLLLVLNFYKHWFYLIQKNKIRNFTLISFEETINCKKNYQNKIKYIFQNLKNVDQIKFENNIKENYRKKEKFEVHTRHKQLIEEYISYYKEVDFSLIV